MSSVIYDFRGEAMVKRLLSISLLFGLLLVGSSELYGEPANSCLDCHREKTKNIVDSWRKSIHSRVPVECQGCHGGDPQSSSKGSAHRGMSIPTARERIKICGSCHSREEKKYEGSTHDSNLLESIKEAPELFSHGVSITRIQQGKQPITGPECTTCHGFHNVLSTSNPEGPAHLISVSKLCGLVCHQKNYSQFIRSEHYQALRREKKAPDCVTCHTSHDNRIVSSEQLSAFCSSCHSPATNIEPSAPLRMKNILELTALARDSLSPIEQRIMTLRQGGWDVAKAELYVEEAKERLAQVPNHWHNMRQDVLYNDLEGIITTLKKAERQLQKTKLLWYVFVSVASAWFLVAFLAWFAFLRTRRYSLFLLASGFSFLFISMFFRNDLYRNGAQVAGAVLIALGVILPEIVAYSRVKRPISRGKGN